MALSWFKKPFDEVTQQEMEKFILNFERGIITYGKNNKPYAKETQSSIKKFIRKYWKWLKGNNKIYPPEVEWIDCSYEEQELPVIIKDEFDMLLSHTIKPDLKFLLVCFFIGGVRKEEFFNLRIEDFDLSGEIPVFNVQVSKTYKRRIGIDLYSDIVSNYLKKSHPDNPNRKAFAYPYSYSNAKKALYRLIKRVLPHRADEHNMSFHMLRRSSATFYAQYLPHYQLCAKYGWGMSSSMPQRYISRANVVVKEISTMIKKVNKEEKIKKAEKMGIEFQAVKEELKELRERDEKREREILLRQKDVEFIQLLMQKIVENPDVSKEEGIQKKALTTVKSDKELFGLLHEIKDLKEG